MFSNPHTPPAEPWASTKLSPKQIAAFAKDHGSEMRDWIDSEYSRAEQTLGDCPPLLELRLQELRWYEIDLEQALGTICEDCAERKEECRCREGAES